jgi:hypothetical protein
MKLFCTKLLVISSIISHAQTNRHDDSLLIGTWKGTSICQVKSSPCNDEIAVYHISKGEKPNTYHMLMNKVVNGKEEEMGTLDYDFDVTKQTLYYQDHQRNAAWNFKVDNHRMDGTLVYKDQLYRIIKLTKADTK